ncbi:hypothetical protein BAUCODRAFT_131084 [Baudoinia panamericana UAMH 10762]|uniref:Uncharacterized protein n=1 Tax=Baudoinia panamericana (strain UAMH 10762) TaxID=717646 RepID=M2MIN4_BAUPA|nr:uncharacterized protein BAUCODRAFT_131084 [Baudoinia panamericana UAMH 10762]EMC96506.1 hypothetical protein BAUCODRAFT_131084 [Baudoinia panamericana UAMH 10762]
MSMQQPDHERFFLLRSSARKRVEDIYKGKEYTWAPIALREVDRQRYLDSPSRHTTFVQRGLYDIVIERIHGRRVRNEFELFTGEDGKEPDDLREQLEEKGFTVRFYAPPQKSKFPSWSKLWGSKDETVFARCLDTLKHAIAVREKKTDLPTKCALLADGGPRGKTDKRRKILLLILTESTFAEYFDRTEFTTNDCTYRIFGAYHNGETRCGDLDDFATYFSRDGREVEACFWDERIQIGQTELEEGRRAKKEAKKHRRRITASTEPSANASMSSEVADGDGSQAQLAAQKKTRSKKQREKKKAQRERQQLQQFADALTSQSGDEGGKHDADANAVTFHNVGTTVQYLLNKRAIRERSAVVKGSKAPDSAKSLRDSSSGNDDVQVLADAEAPRSVRVLRANTTDDINAVLHRASETGGPVMIATDEDVAEGGQLEGLGLIFPNKAQ